jgi:mono/diheme cytochrome c family protein
MKPIIMIFAIAAGLPLAAAPAADLYKTKCTMCHGADGSGNTPMGKKLALRDLREKPTQAQSDPQLVALIENGKDKMPGQKGRLSKDEMKQLATFVRGLSKGR